MKKEKEIKKLKNLIEQTVLLEFDRLNEEAFFMQDPLFRTFVEPFTDIIDTARAEVSKLSAVTQENVKKLAKQAVYLTIPFVSSVAIKKAQKDAEAAIKKRVGQVNNQYKEVYQRTWNALRNRDFLGFAFLLGPILPLGDQSRGFAVALKMLKDGTGMALQTLDTLSGGHPTFSDWARRYTAAISAHVPTYGGSGGFGGGGFGGGYGDFGGDFGGFGESLYEQQQPIQQPSAPAPQAKPQQPVQKQQIDPEKKKKIEEIQKTFAKELQQIAKDPSFQAAVAKSPITKDLQKVAVDAIQTTLQPVLKASNYEQLKRAIGPEFSKIETEVNKSIPEETMTPELKAQFEADFVQEFKEVYKNMFINQIKNAAMPGTEKLISDLIKQIKNS